MVLNAEEPLSQEIILINITYTFSNTAQIAPQPVLIIYRDIFIHKLGYYRAVDISSQSAILATRILVRNESV